MYKVFITYLASPPSSVATEQLISSGGNVYDRARKRLTPKKEESLIYITTSQNLI